MREDLPWSLIDGYFVCRRARDRLLETQGVENAFVEDLFGPPTVPHLLVVVFEALPMGAEGGQAIFVDVVDAVVVCKRGV